MIVHEAPVTAGAGAEIAAHLQQSCFLNLEAPICRIGGFDTPFPHVHEVSKDIVFDSAQRVTIRPDFIPYFPPFADMVQTRTNSDPRWAYPHLDLLNQANLYVMYNTTRLYLFVCPVIVVRSSSIIKQYVTLFNCLQHDRIRLTNQA